MPGQIRPKFELVRYFMPVLFPISLMTTEFIVTEKKGDTIFPIQSQWERSRANNYIVKSPTRPKFELIRDFMHVFVTCKFDKDPIKCDRENAGTPFSIICQCELSDAMVTTVSIRSAPKPNAAFPPPQRCY